MENPSDVVTINNESDTKEEKIKTKKKYKMRKGLSSKSTHHHPQNGAYGKRPEDVDYVHDNCQVLKKVPKWTLQKPHGPRVYPTEPKTSTKTIWKLRNKVHEVRNATNAWQGGVPSDQR